MTPEDTFLTNPRSSQLSLHLNEIRPQLRIASPIILAYLLQSAIPLTNTIFVGHLPGDHSATIVAGVGLGVSFNNVFGLSIGYGFATALDTFLSQAYTMAISKGLPPHKVLSSILHRFFLILALLTVPILIIWGCSEYILVSILQQNPEEAALAARYVHLTIPGLIPLFVFECLKKYVQAQGHTLPVLYVLLVTGPLAVLLNYLLVLGPFSIGYNGAAISTCIIYYLMPMMMCVMIWKFKLGKPWRGWNWTDMIRDWKPMLKVGLPGILMVCSEWWAFEISVLAAAKIKDDAVSQSVQIITLLIASFVYNIPFGISVAATTRTGNMIGAQSPKSAKIAATTSLGLATAFAVLNSSILLILRNHLGNIFTHDARVIKLMARVIPILALFQIADGYAAIGAGVLRGCGKQRIGAYANLVGYYIVGIPIALALCFAPSVQMGVIGLWTGLCIGLFICAGIIITFVSRTDWQEQVRIAEAGFDAEIKAGDIELGSSNTTTPTSIIENEIECDTPILFSRK